MNIRSSFDYTVSHFETLTTICRNVFLLGHRKVFLIILLSSGPLQSSIDRDRVGDGHEMCGLSGYYLVSMRQEVFKFENNLGLVRLYKTTSKTFQGG